MNSTAATWAKYQAEPLMATNQKTVPRAEHRRQGQPVADPEPEAQAPEHQVREARGERAVQ